MEKYTATGNDFISLPKITAEGKIEDVTFLYMGIKGMFDLSGDDDAPFLETALSVDGVCPKGETREEKICFWIPRFITDFPEGKLEQTILAPPTERGFLLRLRYVNHSQHPQMVKLGAKGRWAHTQRVINEKDEVDLPKRLDYGWQNAPVFFIKNVAPLFCFSFLTAEESRSHASTNGRFAEYSFWRGAVVGAGESLTFTLAFGLGYDGVAAVTSALEMIRQTYDCLWQKTTRFLLERMVKTGDLLADERLHYNLFFCYFFAAGRTIDTEEFAMMTSRSPRYYVSAAYWDRDSLLWAFPAILQVDVARAKEMLDYVFIRQINNVGEHSRYIDGTLLEPGFELDELCAPILALCQYAQKTADAEFLKREYVVEGVRRILRKLSTKKHATLALYETFLYPSDDMRQQPYLAYDNALVAAAYKGLAQCYHEQFIPAFISDFGKDFCQEWKWIACEIQNAVFAYCVASVEMEDGAFPIFAWGVDGEGNSQIYDEPPGSLVLLPYLGFCEKENEIYQNTLRFLYAKEYPFGFCDEPFSELGCAHYPKPWVLSYCNSVLAERCAEGTVKQMLQMPMDNGLACESISERDGMVTSGEAFATCAGLYAYALMVYYRKI